MEIDFWAQRWKEGRIGFHEGRANAFLERHVDRLGQARPRRVLVPLCGKTEDLVFLASRGFDVVGVEVVEEAVRAFFVEHGLGDQVHVTDGEHGRAYSAPAARIAILCGDLFAFTRDDVGPIDALYDRAALVAVAPPSRPRYVQHLRGLLGHGAAALVVTFDYPSGAMEGPPFSVNEREVRELFDGADVEAIDAAPVPRFASIGATECCFAIST